MAIKKITKKDIDNHTKELNTALSAIDKQLAKIKKTQSALLKKIETFAKTVNPSSK
ncbi:hypothetical protein HQ487_05240 [Candidatus Uhrbacteria bacterium]|nr:hypothetical protein [Candidatus Uhrbacteria bacterium]